MAVESPSVMHFGMRRNLMQLLYEKRQKALGKIEMTSSHPRKAPTQICLCGTFHHEKRMYMMPACPRNEYVNLCISEMKSEA